MKVMALPSASWHHWRRWHLRAALVVGVALFGGLATAPEAQNGGAGAEHWVGTWATAVVARPQGFQAGPPAFGPRSGFGPAPQAPAGSVQSSQPQAAPNSIPAAPGQAVQPSQGDGRGPGPGGGRGFGVPPLNINNQTLRQIVRTSIGGDRVRVVFSNAFGTAPLPVGAAHIALRQMNSAVALKSDRTLTFGGSASTTIPAGAVIVSDPVSLAVPAFADLAIDLYLPLDTASPSPVTTHFGALQTSYVSPAGDHAGAADMPVMTTTQSWFFLARVEVATAGQVGALVAFGDSITDGTRSTPDMNARWPDRLARRLAAQNITMGVLNQGIAGNRILADGAGVSALARFDRDVLVQTGATHAIVLESINDIGLARDNPTPTADELIAAHRQLIERAHARGLRIFGATLTPFEGAAYWTAEGEAKRQAVNQWIRTSKAYDGVVDFDSVVRDPGAPTRLLPKYNPGDNLHMNDAGYQAMANTVDLALFTSAAARKK